MKRAEKDDTTLGYTKSNFYEALGWPTKSYKYIILIITNK
jgi:hypothetical protein